MEAPQWQVSEWLNSKRLSLAGLRGRVVALHAFQMLCPGCVSHGVPQAMRIRQAFAADRLVVVGLHSVFEHHEVMTSQALRAFVDEYKLTIPIGVDAPSADGIPKTMRAYGLRGTPSLVIIDQMGRIAEHWFGRPDDMTVGAAIGRLVAPAQFDAGPTNGCDANGCTV